MKVHAIPAREVGADLQRSWTQIQDANPELGSPYLCFEFTRAVAAVRDDVEVGVIESGAGPVGFFPFMRTRRHVGQPVGGRLSDCQAVIAAPSTEWEAQALLSGCDLAIYDFDHLLTAQQGFAAHHRTTARSPVIDLSGGFESYLEERRASGGRIRQVQRKARKLEREVGELRFEAQTADTDVLERVLEWKSEQCRRTGVVDFFRQMPWTAQLVRRIHETRTDEFSGVLSALYAGDELVAAHLGMRSRRVWHWWFPVYREEFSRHSPGAVLLLEVVRRAAEEGLRTVDLGKGEDAYKHSFMNAEIPLAEGSAVRPTLAGAMRRTGDAARRFLRTSPWAAPARTSWRGVRQLARLAQAARRARRTS